MNKIECIRISGKPVAEADVLPALTRLPNEPVFIDFLSPVGWITLQANLVNRCWQIFRTLPDGSVEFTEQMFSPQEAAAWWQQYAASPTWYAEQTWHHEVNSKSRTFRRLILLTLAGILLVIVGILLIRAAVAG